MTPKKLGLWTSTAAARSSISPRSASPSTWPAESKGISMHSYPFAQA
ncbi:MAG: hypothetical protein MUF17_12600 [Syntrophales bacterium]|nr:hypothetical protein [Syntrophales bacterium]